MLEEFLAYDRTRAALELERFCDRDSGISPTLSIRLFTAEPVLKAGR